MRVDIFEFEKLITTVEEIIYMEYIPKQFHSNRRVL